MKTGFPDFAQIMPLRQLWQDAFGDGDTFLDAFFATAFHPQRCCCISETNHIAAALYWFPTHCKDAPLAYLYAIATAPAYRNQGLCRQLMAETEQILMRQGYLGSLLVPQNQPLSRMYRTMGYEFCSDILEFTCTASEAPISFRHITGDEYAALRQPLLPVNSITQADENMSFLQTQCTLLAGDGFLAALDLSGGTLRCQEFLGVKSAAAGLLRALDLPCGTFRGPGTGRPFAMWKPFVDHCPRPAYFGLAFD